MPVRGGGGVLAAVHPGFAVPAYWAADRCGKDVGMPWIDLEGAVNVRDVGGLPTSDGGAVVGGRLLRADNLQDLSPSDVELLVGELGVTTVVDLRSSTELQAEGPAPLDLVVGVRHAHHPVLPESGTATDAAADALLLTREDRASSVYPEDRICGRYLLYLEDRPDQVVAALRSVAYSQGAALVHCAAGKDRTGVVVAIALTAVSVRPEAVVADYAATADRIGAVIDRLRRSPTYAEDMNGRPAESHRPRPETMTAFLEQMDSRYGGVTTWLADHSFGADDLAALRARLREP